MLVNMCFILLSMSNMDSTYTKTLVQTSRIVAVIGGKKESTIRLLNTQYDASYGIKETPEEVLALIKKECK